MEEPGAPRSAMMTPHHSLRLGDFARCVRALQPDVETAADILQLLGIAAPGTAEVEAEPKRPAPAPPKTATPPAPPARIETPPLDSTPKPRPGAQVSSAPVKLSLQSSTAPADSSEESAWLSEPPRALFDGGEPRATAPLLALEPLFAPLAQRNLLAAALCTLVDEGDVLVERLAERLSRGLPVRRIPRALRPTMRASLDVLVDRGEGMMPFTRDAREVVSAVRSLAGSSKTRVLRFDGDPGLAGPGAKRTYRRYDARPPGTTVLVISELGVYNTERPRRDVVDTWRDFAVRMARAGSWLIVLSPLSHDRMPPDLSRLFPIISWDRSARLSTLRAAHRRGRGVP